MSKDLWCKMYDKLTKILDREPTNEEITDALIGYSDYVYESNKDNPEFYKERCYE